MKIGTIVLNPTGKIFHVLCLSATTRCFASLSMTWGPTNHRLYQGDLGNLSGVAFAAAQLGDAGVAAGASDIAGSKLLEHLLDDQFIGQGAENLAARVQLNHHRLVSRLQSALGLGFVGDDAQEFLAAILELVLQELAAFRRQRGFALIEALLIAGNAIVEGEATATGELHQTFGLLLVFHDGGQVFPGSQAALNRRINQFFDFTTNGAGARLGGLYAIVADQARHQVATGRAALRLRHAHPVTGYSMPQLSPPFPDRRPYRLQRRSDADSDSAGSCGRASVRATLAGSFPRNCAPPAGLPRSSKAPGPLW